ncbi:hypothetical protein EV2_000038 [Malus domestica]
MITFSKIEEKVKEQYHCWIIGKSLCVNLCASWQGRLANMPNLYSHSRKHSQQDCLLQNRRDTALRISRARPPAGLLSQKSKRRLLSHKLGCSETTKVDLRNRRGVCFLKSWAAQRPRRPISEIEEACFLKSWAAQRPRGLISEIKETPTFPALSAPVTRTLSFAEIMGILSKISDEVEST